MENSPRCQICAAKVMDAVPRPTSNKPALCKPQGDHHSTSFPEDPCMVYLPTFTLKINQM